MNRTKLQQISQDHIILLKPFRLEQRVQHVRKKTCRAGEANKVKQIHDKLLERNADVGVSDPQDFNSHLSKVRAKMYSQ